jgi:hypothetical protein
MPAPKFGRISRLRAHASLQKRGAFTAESIFVQTSVPYDKPFLDKVQKESKN